MIINGVASEYEMPPVRNPFEHVIYDDVVNIDFLIKLITMPGETIEEKVDVRKF